MGLGNSISTLPEVTIKGLLAAVVGVNNVISTDVIMANDSTIAIVLLTDWFNSFLIILLAVISLFAHLCASLVANISFCLL